MVVVKMRAVKMMVVKMLMVKMMVVVCLLYTSDAADDYLTV